MTTAHQHPDIDFAALAPVPESPVLPLSDYQRREILLLRDYEMAQARQRAEQDKVAEFNRQLLERNIVLGLIGVSVVGGVAWYITATFNPASFGISVVVTSVIGWLTYPGKRKGIPTFPANLDPVQYNKANRVECSNKIVNININVSQ